MILIPTNGVMMPPTPKISMLRARIFPEDMGRYFTPFMARGMRQGMMMALKINAERMAL